MQQAKNGHAEAFSVLQIAGVDVDAVGDGGATPMTIAAAQGSAGIVKVRPSNASYVCVPVCACVPVCVHARGVACECTQYQHAVYRDTAYGANIPTAGA